MTTSADGADHREEYLDKFNRLLTYEPSLIQHLQDLLRAVAAHLPRVVASTELASPSRGPIALPLEGTAMFADIDGFTPLAERFSQAASEEGAEELTELVNRFLEILITTTAQYGGDLQKFGGDAGMLTFTGENHAQRAVAAGLDVLAAMDAEMGEVETSLGRFPLRIAIGLGSGRMVGLGLGNWEGREWLVTGTPLKAMGHAQSEAPPGGLAIDKTTKGYCGNALTCRNLEKELWLVEGLRHPSAPYQLAPLLTPPDADAATRLGWMLSRLDALTPYLAPGLLERLTTATALDRLSQWSEHRQVTILMLSLSGFPDLTVYWENPEGLQRAVAEPNGVFIQTRDVIQRYDGIVNKIGSSPQGAYVMALFGAPTAHEDDPLRAVLAALELQEVSEVPLRLGINTGFVFAGDVGSAQRREYTVMGDDVNLAYRLMSSAPAGQIWLGPNTAHHHSIVRRAEVTQQAPHRFKGKRHPITPFVVQRTRKLFSGADIGDIPLIGREKECDYLKEALQKTLSGTAQAILIHGDAGVGKSRLVQELAGRCQQEKVAVHIGAAPSYGGHLPYAVWENPTLTLLELDELPRTETVRAQARSQAFHEVLAGYGLETWAALLAPLAGLDVPPSPEVAALSPELREQRRRATLQELWTQAAQEQPRLLVLENAQWIPQATLNLLDDFLKNLPAAPLLVVITCREEAAVIERWQDLARVQDMPLGALSRRPTVQLAREVANTSKLPSEVERWIVKRGSGIPLFVMEAIRTLVTSGILERSNGDWQLSHPLEEVPLPDTAYGMIQSRIDQLEPPSRHLLRAATVVGEQMTVPMLVAGYGEETRSAVARRLPSLAPMGLVAGDPQGETLVFRQPLVREVAYRGLPYRIRRLVHQRIGDYLERYREEATSNWLTLLAHHTFEGQAWEKAVQSNLDLGQRAMRNYLMDQAVQAFERVLESASAGRLSTPEACFEAHHLLGDTLTILGQYDAALEHLEAARALLPAVPTEPEDILHLADLEYHIASALESQGHYDVAFEAVQRGLNLNGVQKSQEGAQLTLMGANLFFRQGHYEKAQAWASESAALAAQFPGVGAQRIRARALYQLAYIVSLRGDPHEALALGQQSLEIYQSLQDLLGEMNTRTNLLLINLNLGQWELAVEHGERGLMLARRIHHTEGEARLAANLGEVYRYQGRFKEARMAYTAALEITQERGIAYGEALMENNLAAIALREGALEEAARRLKRAEEIYQKLGSEQMLPEIYRHRGFLYLQQEATDKARLWGQRSLEVAEAQGARPEIGRTLQLLAEICIHEGKCEIARDHISKARVLLQEAQDRYGEAQAILTEARFQHHCGTRSQAITLAKEAQAHFEALGAAWDSAQAQALLESWEVGT